jgi:opacity protein-like surface antigen
MKRTVLWMALVAAAGLGWTVSVWAGEAGGKEVTEKQVSPEEGQGLLKGVYIGVVGGGAISDNDAARGDLDGPVGVLPTAFVQGSSISHAGAVGGFAVGKLFDFALWQSGDGQFKLLPALEFEGVWVGQTYSTNVNGFLNPVPFAPGVFTFPLHFRADADVGLLTLNAKLVLATPWGVLPYVGAGFGGGIIELSKATLVTQPGPGAFFPPGMDLLTSHSAGDAAPTAQGIAGVLLPIGAHWALVAQYNFVWIGNTNYVFQNILPPGDPFHVHAGDLFEHVFVGGLVYRF